MVTQADISRKIRIFQILRGRHSAPGQRYRHGWIPIGDAGADRFVGTMRDEATIRKAYDYHDEPTGLTARVLKITDHGPGEPVEVEIAIHDRSGNKVGEAGRVVERDGHGVYHDALMLDGPVQGQGFATRYNQNAERTYRAAGIDEIRLLANVDVGGYAWARAGYDFRNSRNRGKVSHRARQTLSEFTPAEQATIQAVLDDPAFTPLAMAMAGWRPGATMWPGKRVMLDSSWAGVKKL